MPELPDVDVIKKYIDWASRPPKSAPSNEKLVGILGASPGMTGSARGQSQLQFTNSYCMLQPEILVYRAHQKFDDNGNLIDEATVTIPVALFLLMLWVFRLRPHNKEWGHAMLFLIGATVILATSFVPSPILLTGLITTGIVVCNEIIFCRSQQSIQEL